MTNPDESPESLDWLRHAVTRIDDVLVPWGFQFQVRESGFSSAGGYANGFYSRGSIRILLIYRKGWGLGSVLYEQEEVVTAGYLREKIVYDLDHQEYMKRIGHSDDCHLILPEESISSQARDGGDPVEALIRDFRENAAPTLREENQEFAKIMRSGRKRRQVMFRKS